MVELKQWVYSICVIIVISSILSLFEPNGNLKRIYKLMISLFIFVSFVTPIKNYGVRFDDFDKQLSQFEPTDNTNSINNSMIENEIKNVLQEENITGASVNCSSKINENNEIEIMDITVAVPDYYIKDEIKTIISDKLSINARVISIGQ